MDETNVRKILNEIKEYFDQKAKLGNNMSIALLPHLRYCNYLYDKNLLSDSIFSGDSYFGTNIWKKDLFGDLNELNKFFKIVQEQFNVLINDFEESNFEKFNILLREFINFYLIDLREIKDIFDTHYASNGDKIQDAKFEETNQIYSRIIPLFISLDEAANN